MGSEPFNCVHLGRGEETSCARLKTRKSSSFQVQIPMQRHQYCSTTVRGRILPVYIRNQKCLSSCWNFDSHRIYLGFQWPFQDKPSYFVFNVLPFLMSIAPYIFTKVLKPVINYWKSAGRRILCFVLFVIDTVFDAILTSRQTRNKLQCLYENLTWNYFRRMAVLKKYEL